MNISPNLDIGQAAQIGLLLIGGLAGFTVFLVGFKMARHKVRKEIGLWYRHRQYRPARPIKRYTFDDHPPLA